MEDFVNVGEKIWLSLLKFYFLSQDGLTVGLVLPRGGRTDKNLRILKLF